MNRAELNSAMHRARRRRWRGRLVSLTLVLLGSVLLLASVGASVWTLNRQLYGRYLSSGAFNAQIRLANGALMVHGFDLSPAPVPSPAHWTWTVLQRHSGQSRSMFSAWQWVPKAIRIPARNGGGVAVLLPLWLPGVLGLAAALLGWRLFPRLDSSRCSSCRYPLTGLGPQTSRCPECGHPLPDRLPQQRDHAVHVKPPTPSDTKSFVANPGEADAACANDSANG